MNDEITRLKAIWQRLFPSGFGMPDEEQWTLWVLRHGEQIVGMSLIEAATKRKKVGGTFGFDAVTRYASSCMNYKSREKERQSAQSLAPYSSDVR
jgi:hypothetical protein